MAKVLKKVFKTKDKAFEEGKEVEREIELAVRIPTAIEKQRARLVYAKGWRDAVEAGAIMREALERYLRDQKLWDDLRQKEYDRLRKNILESERKMKMGGNAGLTKKQARELALQIGDWRDDLSELLTERNRVDANTADAIADQLQFNYFVAVCTVYNETGKPYFTINGIDPAIEAYIDKSTEKPGLDAATKFAEIWYGTDDDSADKLPEKKFLKEYGFADEKGRLIDKAGHLVDRKGRLLDENGRFINDKGEFVDTDGQRVDTDGQYIVDFAPFLKDDDDTDDVVPPPSPALELPKVVKTEVPEVEKVENPEPALAGK
jgi:hypothetical protein